MENFDIPTGDRELPELSPDESVWVTDCNTLNCVIELSINIYCIHKKELW